MLRLLRPAWHVDLVRLTYISYLCILNICAHWLHIRHNYVISCLQIIYNSYIGHIVHIPMTHMQAIHVDTGGIATWGARTMIWSWLRQKRENMQGIPALSFEAFVWKSMKVTTPQTRSHMSHMSLNVSGLVGFHFPSYSIRPGGHQSVYIVFYTRVQRWSRPQWNAQCSGNPWLQIALGTDFTECAWCTLCVQSLIAMVNKEVW
jgi:hypothetical protein